MNKTVSTFQKMIDVNIPIIYINDHDFARVNELIEEVTGDSSVIEWNPAEGTRLGPVDGPVQNSLADFLRARMNSGEKKEKYVIIRESHEIIRNSPEIKTLLALIAQKKIYDRNFETTIILVSSVLDVPEEIEKYVSFLEIDYPDDEEIMELINSHIEVNGYDKEKFTQKDREELMPSLKGLTRYEIDRMLDMAMSSSGTLSSRDREMILQQKKQMVKKSGILELIDTPESIDSIGGLDVLKDYLKRKAEIYNKLSDAIKFGVTVPKGVFLVGMPGCGKSLCAKAAAAQFKVPLLKLDMGRMMNKYVGESERNLRKAIAIAEATAPCVLWIDEIEKTFSGVGGNNDVLSRMFGYFLSWMQEKKSAVYVFATANNAEKMPPELKRKGRFDEIFCVNLPNEKERKEIFDVHIKKKRKSEINIKEGLIIDGTLLKSTEGFNGADIEAVVNEAVENCFLDKKDLTIEGLIKVAKKTKSITKSCKKQIKDMEKLFMESDFTDASKEANGKSNKVSG